MAINSLSSASRGIAGLASGINTEETVNKLLSGTQGKIDKATQKKATLQNKQSMYREVANKIKALQTGFMSFTSKTNLMSSSFYNNMTATLRTPSNKSAAFSVTASSNTAAGTYKLSSIEQLATAYTMKTKQNASGAVKGGISASVAANLVKQYQGGDVPADASLFITVGDKKVIIDDAPELFGGKSAQEVVDILNTKLSGAGAKAQASFVNNKLTIIADNPETFISVEGNTGDAAKDKTLSMKMFGDGIGSLGGKGTFSATIDPDLYLPKITVELDGRKQDIHMSLDALKKFAGIGPKDSSGNPTTIPSDDGAALETDLTNKLKHAFGSGVKLTLNKASGVIEFAAGSTSSKLTLTGDAVTMGVFGIKSGTSNKLNPTMSLEDLNFSNNLQGSRHSFSINGVDFSYNANTSLSTVINDINASKAGVKISYLEAEDRFVMQRSQTGKTDPGDVVIDMKQTEGNLLSVLFGQEGGSDYTGFALTQPIVGSAVDPSDYRKGGNYTFNINGRDYIFSVPRKGKDEIYSVEDFTKELNKQFRNNFGTLPDGTQALELKYDSNTTSFTMLANDKNLVVKTAPYHVDYNPFTLGFAADASNRITKGDTTIDKAGIDFGTTGSIQIMGGSGGPIVLTAAELNGKSLDDIAAALQTKLQTIDADAKVVFDKNTAAFRIMGVDVPMEIVVNEGDGSGTEKLFGSSHIKMHEAQNNSYIDTPVDGTDAVVYIDGMKLERSSNTFEYGGMSFTLHSEYNKGQGAAGEATEVVVTRDTKAVVEGIQEYLKQYNETINYLNELYKADPTYKDYPPLTAEQKQSMSETEINNWEEKSKEGLLRNDANLGRILQTMRSAMYTRPEGSSIAIYDLGIDTSYYSKDGNFDMTSEANLKAMLEKDPEAVMRLFSGTGGIMDQVNTAINAAISGGGSPGYLTREAGSNNLDTASNIYKQIKSIDEQLSTLEKRYWKEYDRYWKQFNAMEQAIQNMNSQSSWLSQSLSGGA